MKTKMYILGFITVMIFSISTTAIGEQLVLQSDDYLPVKVNSESPVSMYFIKFDLSRIPENARIDAAVLRFTADVDSSAKGGLTLAAYPLGETWTSSSRPAVCERVAFNDSLLAFAFDVGYTKRQVDISIEDAVRSWVSGRSKNYGLVITNFDNPGSGVRIYTDTPGVVAHLHILYSTMRSSR